MAEAVLPLLERVVVLRRGVGIVVCRSFLLSTQKLVEITVCCCFSHLGEGALVDELQGMLEGYFSGCSRPCRGDLERFLVERYMSTKKVFGKALKHKKTNNPIKSY